jgi:predicted helicase
LFGSVSEENVARIKRQNARKISVIIGNPPYNANQQNENDNNKNRTYPRIDERIKATYIAESTAQKTKAYDMYTRFFRWASDRLKDEGIIAFVSNSSFIDARTLDGFRKIAAREFNDIWIIDLKGNARTSGERRRQEGGNIFDDKIRVGVAVYFCVKNKKRSGCEIHYQAVRSYAKADEKRDFLSAAPIYARPFEKVIPSSDGTWINVTDDDFDTFVPIASNETKATKARGQERAIFKIFGNGVNTARDSWVIDSDKKRLQSKVEYFLRKYDQSIDVGNLSPKIKLSRNLKVKFTSQHRESFQQNHISRYNYRPYFAPFGYLSNLLIDELGSVKLFGGSSSPGIAIPNGGEFRCLAAVGPIDFHFIGDSRVLGRAVLSSDGARHDNITDWALDQFRAHYEAGTPSPLAGEGGPRSGPDEGLAPDEARKAMRGRAAKSVETDAGGSNPSSVVADATTPSPARGEGHARAMPIKA